MRPPPTAAQVQPADLATHVDARILTLLDSDASRWAAVDPQLAEPLAALRRLVAAGGKRLRPAFCYWAFRGAGGDAGDPRVIDAGAALEMLHTGALVHDDIIDSSIRRRGVEVVHSAFARRHRVAGWQGESGRFGEGVGILVGDLAVVYADMLLGDVPREAWAVFDELRLELNIGQYLDLLGTVRRDATEASARRISLYKSGKYTIERPLHLGAALADPAGLAGRSGPLSRYGQPLGEAFQLKDDLLGTFGDVAVTGKPAGEDLREGKPTLLYALASRRAVGAAGELLAARFGAPDLTEDEVVAIQHVLEDTGARAEVEATIDRLVHDALAAAEGLPLETEAIAALAELAVYVASRER
jgi:geranylgeranyl diphosphate synthase type I